MKNISLTVLNKPNSNYITLKGSLVLNEALALKEELGNFCHSDKDLYIDIKEVDKIDINGLTAFLLARHLTNRHDADFYLFVNAKNPLFNLLSEIKFTNQLKFRDCIIIDSPISVAS